MKNIELHILLIKVRICINNTKKLDIWLTGGQTKININSAILRNIACADYLVSIS